MEKLLLVRESFMEAFRHWGNLILKKHFRAFSWFCFALWVLTLYAFLFRVSRGFDF
jgi:hypothetical protein